MRDTLGADVDYRRGGNLRLARTPEEVDIIRGIVESQRAQGLDLDFLPDNAAVRAVAPGAVGRTCSQRRIAAPTGTPTP